MSCYSAGNFQFMDKESTGRMVFLLGIIRSGMRNSMEEWHSAGNYQLVDEESPSGVGFRQEILAHVR
jgi:hypothetical protein